MALTDPFILSVFFVFAAEMGDKTQLVALGFATRYAAQTVLLGVFVATLLVHLFKTMLMTVTLASQHHSFVSVWLGSTLGMVLADGLAIIVGRVVGARLPEKLIKYGAAGIFLITGTVTLIEAVSNRWLQ
jgi:putative Ca2+/H+ antiporter (TMEM165/GDT1 family)